MIPLPQSGSSRRRGVPEGRMRAAGPRNSRKFTRPAPSNASLNPQANREEENGTTHPPPKPHSQISAILTSDFCSLKHQKLGSPLQEFFVCWKAFQVRMHHVVHVTMGTGGYVTFEAATPPAYLDSNPYPASDSNLDPIMFKISRTESRHRQDCRSRHSSATAADRGRKPAG